MKEQYKFGTAINCIDGRTQQPVIDYIKQNYAVDMVDMITFPGANGIFSNELRLVEASLAKHSTSISVEKHNSRIIAVVGHYDCAGNPGDKSHHYVQSERLCKRYLYGNSLQKSLVSMLTTTGKLKKLNNNFSSFWFEKTTPT